MLLIQVGTQGGNMKIRISLSNQLRVLSFQFVGVILMLIILYFLNFNIDALTIFGIFFIALTLPAIYLHIEYYITNRKQEITIGDDDITLNTKMGDIYIYKFSELSKVILYKSASIDKGGIQFTPIESYHYLRIITNSKKQIIITCLMYPKLDEVVNELKGVKKLRIKRLFCTLLWK